jgi:hypothetical protein
MEREKRTQGARPEPGDLDPRVDRRTFLGGAAALTGAAAIETLGHDSLFRAASALAAGALQPIDPTQKPNFSIDVHRREDFLFLRVDGYNLIRSGQNLVRKNVRLESRLVITFVPQHLAEEAFAAGATAAKPGSARAIIAAPSRLAFIVPKPKAGVPAAQAGVPLTLDGLLEWTSLQPALAAAAAYTGPVRASRHATARSTRRSAAKHRATAHRAASTPPTLAEPGPDETSIELPWHLALSPTADGRWVHDVEPRTLGDATELWRTKLVTPEGLVEQPGGAVRAVWNYDTQGGRPTLDAGTPAKGVGPFTSSLEPLDRWGIVKSSADFTIKGRADISAKQLLLSARGGSLTSEASWSTALQITEWTHEATQGRDQYVKVVNRGFLFPFGHQVSLVKVTQREFDEVGSQTVGVLRQTTYLVVSDPVVSYDPSVNPAVANNGRDFPFRALELKDSRTPTLDRIHPFVDDGNSPSDLSNPPPFVPAVGGTPVSWHFVGTDWSGRTTSFLAQAVFVSFYDGIDPRRMNLVRNAYNGRSSTDPLRTTDFGGRTLTFAESYEPGDTDMPAYGMTFAASPGAPGSGQFARFVPTLAAAVAGVPTGAQVAVGMPAVEQASGAPLSGNAHPTLAYYAAYVEAGFHSAESTANKGNVYMQTLGDATTAPSLNFAGKSAGGVLTPNLQVQGLSRSLGPVADLDNIFKGSFDPSSVFKALEGKLAAKILGGVSLSDLIAPANLLGSPGATPDVPNPEGLKIKSTRKGDIATTTVTWSPKLRDPLLPGVPKVITARPEADHPLSFSLACTTTTDLTQPLNSKYSLHGELNNFVVNLVSTDPDDQFISVTFKTFGFTSVSGGKPKIDVKIDGVNFDGALKFVEQLASFMGLDGGGGPNVTSLVDSISSDLSIKLPSINVGILSLSHVAIDTGFRLPLDGGPSLFNFGFASNDNPFALAIGIFGGGGFLSLSIGTVGVKSIEGSFEFGAMAALDVGVASGAVSLTAGFYFAFSIDVSKKPVATTCVLSGFVKLTGNLNVLGIITLALEFDLTLTYVDPPGKITGTATLVVSISLLYFHKSVTLTASKTFVNSGSSSSARPAISGGPADALINGPHTFADQMTQSDWITYCQAFAPVS